MLPSTKIFIGISMIITGIFLAVLVPFSMEIPKEDALAHAEMVDQMLESAHHAMIGTVIASILLLGGFIFLLFGIYSAARMVECIYYNTKPASLPPEAGTNS